jgi:fatty acid desaturase
MKEKKHEFLRNALMFYGVYSFFKPRNKKIPKATTKETMTYLFYLFVGFVLLLLLFVSPPLFIVLFILLIIGVFRKRKSASFRSSV